MLDTITSNDAFITNEAEMSGGSPQRGTALAVRDINSGTSRVSPVRAEGGEAGSSQLAAVAADVANAVGRATLRYRENNSWLQLELELWEAMTETIEKWRRRSPAPGLWPRPAGVDRSSTRRALEPVRFKLRRR